MIWPLLFHSAARSAPVEGGVSHSIFLETGWYLFQPFHCCRNDLATYGLVERRLDVTWEVMSGFQDSCNGGQVLNDRGKHGKIKKDIRVHRFRTNILVYGCSCPSRRFVDVLRIFFISSYRNSQSCRFSRQLSSKYILHPTLPRQTFHLPFIVFEIV